MRRVEHRRRHGEQATDAARDVNALFFGSDPTQLSAMALRGPV